MSSSSTSSSACARLGAAVSVLFLDDGVYTNSDGIRRKMPPEDELTLPPWTKLAIYGRIPWKLSLHVCLLVVITFQAFSSNILFAPYSRAMWSSVVSIYFPPDYQSNQTPLTSAYQYYIFTQDQAVEDGNKLFHAYFTMPDVSVNQVKVHTNSTNTNDLPMPSVAITTTSGKLQQYPLSSLSAINTGWPLGRDAGIVGNPEALRSFFRSLKQMQFSFPILSYGNNDNVEEQPDVCYQWTIGVLYDLSSAGQILVTSTADLQARCQGLDSGSVVYLCSLLVALLSGMYQLLLVKASARRLVILHGIRVSVRSAQGLASANANSNTIAGASNSNQLVYDHPAHGASAITNSSGPGPGFGLGWLGFPPSSSSSSSSSVSSSFALNGPGPGSSSSYRLLPSGSPDVSSTRQYNGNNNINRNTNTNSTIHSSGTSSSNTHLEPFAAAGHLLDDSAANINIGNNIGNNDNINNNNNSSSSVLSPLAPAFGASAANTASAHAEARSINISTSSSTDGSAAYDFILGAAGTSTSANSATGRASAGAGPTVQYYGQSQATLSALAAAAAAATAEASGSGSTGRNAHTSGSAVDSRGSLNSRGSSQARDNDYDENNNDIDHYSSRHDSTASATSISSNFDETAFTLRQALDSLTFVEILGVLNVWFFISSAGNLSALLYSCRVVFFRDDIATDQYLKNCLGMACLLVWFGAVQYLEFFPRYYIMIAILKKTTPRVSRFLLGVLPLFIGYALLGLVAFGDQVDQFGDVSQTLRTLFSVVNGDIIYQTFNAVDFMGIGGSIYIYVYILVFTYVVLMTIIAIVEEAFFEANGDERGGHDHGHGHGHGSQGQGYADNGSGGGNELATNTRGNSNSRTDGPGGAGAGAVSRSYSRTNSRTGSRNTSSSFSGLLPAHTQTHTNTGTASASNADAASASAFGSGSGSGSVAASALHADRDRDRDRDRERERVESTSGGKRVLPDSLRLLLNANAMVREHEEHELERRKSRVSVDVHGPAVPFYR